MVACSAPVSEALEHEGGRLLNRHEESGGRPRSLCLLHHRAGARLQKGALGFRRIVQHRDFVLGRWQQRGDGLRHHGFARARRADEKKVPPLLCYDFGQTNGLILAYHLLEQVAWHSHS